MENSMQKMNLTLSIAAGLLGGLLSHYVAPLSVFAQAQAVPKEIRAQSFVLVDEQSRVLGLFSSDQSKGKASSYIKLFDSNGREIWAASETKFRPLGQQR